MSEFRQMAVVGLGLLGGSVALAARERGVVSVRQPEAEDGERRPAVDLGHPHPHEFPKADG